MNNQRRGRAWRAIPAAIRRKLLGAGAKCCNCGSTECLDIHHIVPLALGGANEESNMCVLCKPCHMLGAHNLQNGEWSTWKAAQRAGMERMRAEGRRNGRKPVRDVVVTVICEQGSIFHHGGMTNVEICAMLGRGATCVSKYQREVKRAWKAGPDEWPYPYVARPEQLISEHSAYTGRRGNR